jgi:hypothetical protein
MSVTVSQPPSSRWTTNEPSRVALISSAAGGRPGGYDRARLREDLAEREQGRCEVAHGHAPVGKRFAFVRQIELTLGHDCQSRTRARRVARARSIASSAVTGSDGRSARAPPATGRSACAAAALTS